MNEELDARTQEILEEFNLHNIEYRDIEDISSTSIIDENTEPVIPPNSGSLLVNEKTSRFSGASWYDSITKSTITLAGLGGIGSWVALLLARLNIDNLIMYDPDTVEAGNMSGQLYSRSNIGYHKTRAISETLYNYADFLSYICIDNIFDNNSRGSDIMICGFDNMYSRKIFFDSWLKRVHSEKILRIGITREEARRHCLFIDGRLSAEEFQVFCIRGDDEYNINRYIKEFLFNDSEADDTICSYKQTSFCANMIASVIVNLFVNFKANSLDPLVPRDLPFYTMYNAETMYFKTEA